jgi:hypothetical protein
LLGLLGGLILLSCVSCSIHAYYTPVFIDFLKNKRDSMKKSPGYRISQSASRSEALIALRPQTITNISIFLQLDERIFIFKILQN